MVNCYCGLTILIWVLRFAGQTRALEEIDIFMADDYATIVYEIANNLGMSNIEICVDKEHFHEDLIQLMAKKTYTFFNYIEWHFWNSSLASESIHKDQSDYRVKTNLKNNKLQVILLNHNDASMGTAQNWNVLQQDKRIVKLLIVNSPADYEFPPTTLEYWITANYIQKQRTANLIESFTFLEPQEPLVESVGTWTRQGNLKLTRGLGFGPTNFHRRQLIATSFETMPYYAIGDSCCPNPDDLLDPTCNTTNIMDVDKGSKKCGYILDILENLALLLNFTYSVVSPPVNEAYFGLGASDNFTGLVGMLVKKKADIILSSMTITTDRLQAMDFSYPIEFYVTNMFMHSEAVQSFMQWTTYTMGFHWTTWIIVLLSIFAYSWIHYLVLYMYHHLDWKKSFQNLSLFFGRDCSVEATERMTQYRENGTTDKQKVDSEGFLEVMFIYFSCMVQQGVENVPTQVTLRGIFCIFWFSSVILFSNYTATLTSILTVKTEKPKFENLISVVRSDWGIGTLSGSAIIDYVMSNTAYPYEDMVKKMKRDPSLVVTSTEEAIRKMLTENYVYYSDTGSLRYLTRNSCEILEIEINDRPTYGRLGLRKNLPFKSVLDITLSKMTDTGLLSKLEKHFWSERQLCQDTSVFKELGFSHVVTAFLVFLAGLVISVAILFHETQNIRSRIGSRNY